ncbi:hypothetical protein J3R30DRAFT_3404416 [Lentinula aciculospora]|uniref:Uncharacterized protein n=1 Tax=Lentinula aciculospora TaxID=153920 RepID=A0A9W9DNB7_9AGAR|nr:hypothetical protein J3R30DRAFT_3404416 [Lentinula aciculospora]
MLTRLLLLLLFLIPLPSALLHSAELVQERIEISDLHWYLANFTPEFLELPQKPQEILMCRLGATKNRWRKDEKGSNSFSPGSWIHKEHYRFVLFLGCIATSVNAAAWVAGFQSSGFTGWNLRQYSHLFEGNPRQVASLIGADEHSLPGVVCGTWTEFKIIGNSNPGEYEFNCVPTPDEINNNAHNNGFYIGGLNHEGVTMALCHIEYSASELCDSDTVSDKNDEACNVWVVCRRRIEQYLQQYLGLIQFEEAEREGTGEGRCIRVEKGIDSTRRLRLSNKEEQQ